MLFSFFSPLSPVMNDKVTHLIPILSLTFRYILVSPGEESFPNF